MDILLLLSSSLDPLLFLSAGLAEAGCPFSMQKSISEGKMTGLILVSRGVAAH